MFCFMIDTRIATAERLDFLPFLSASNLNSFNKLQTRSDVFVQSLDHDQFMKIFQFLWNAKESN